MTVHPNYNQPVSTSDSARLAQEIANCIRDAKPDAAALESPQGFDIAEFYSYPLLKKYVRTVILYKTQASGAWIQIAPPGDYA